MYSHTIPNLPDLIEMVQNSFNFLATVAGVLGIKHTGAARSDPELSMRLSSQRPWKVDC